VETIIPVCRTAVSNRNCLMSQKLCHYLDHGCIERHMNTLASTRIRGFSEKKHLNARGFAREFLWSGMLYRSGKSLIRRGKSSSLHLKKIFAWELQVFCEWRHKWRSFRTPWPTLPGPGRQPLGGSISLKFLLETRLQSESFDTLDDLLGFWFQKLWCKLVKIFD